MQKNEIDLSIIIINFGNTKEYTQKCLESLTSAVSKIKSEIIVIDNISSDGTREMIKSSYPTVKYIRKDKPYGFGENNNFGINISKGRYILFLNSDTEIIEDNTFIEMINWMDEHPEVGASSTALLNSDKKTLQGSGGSFPNLIRVFMWMTLLDDIPFIDKIIKPFHPMHSQSPLGSNEDYYTKSHEQDWITGAFYLVRKSVLDKVGSFDIEYNAYVEEVDLSYRIKNEGYKIWYLPKWKIIHHGGVSYGGENSFIFEMKNVKTFYRKHYPKWQLPILNIIIKIGCLLRIVIFSLINPKLSKIYAKAFKTV